MSSARRTWPDLEVEEPSFRSYLERHFLPLREEKAADLSTVFVEDLYLVFACLQGSARALADFDRRYVGPLDRPLRAAGIAEGAIDEVKQLVRQRLLVAGPNGPPRLAGYQGRGPLATWVQVAAIRLAISLGRKVKSTRDLETLFSEAHQRMSNPELTYRKASCQAAFTEAFQAAFREALRRLSSLERTLLRLHHLDGLTTRTIAKLHGVNQATASRWLTKARRSLLSTTRGLLGERFALTGSEIDSLVHLVASQLEISLGELAKKSTDPVHQPSGRASSK